MEYLNRYFISKQYDIHAFSQRTAVSLSKVTKTIVPILKRYKKVTTKTIKNYDFRDSIKTELTRFY